MNGEALSMLIKECLREVLSEEFDDDQTWQGTVNVEEANEEPTDERPT